MPELAIAAQIAGTAISVLGSIRQGQAADEAGKYNASVLRARANESRAASQRAAEEETRKSKIMQSNAIAAAAASGAGATDTTVVQTVSDLAGYGEYESLTKLYEGESAARGYESQANMSIFEGKQKKQAAYGQAAGTLFKTGGSMFEKYGSDLFDGENTISRSDNYDPEGQFDNSLPWRNQPIYS